MCGGSRQRLKLRSYGKYGEVTCRHFENAIRWWKESWNIHGDTSYVLVKSIFRWTTNHCVSCALPFTLTEINCRLFDGNYEERAKQGIIASARMFELPIERGTSAFVGRLSPHLKTRGQEWTEGLMHFLCLSKPTFPYPTLSPSNSLSLFLGLGGLATSLTFRTLE